jgi:hypothetical protein
MKLPNEACPGSHASPRELHQLKGWVIQLLDIGELV